MVFSNSLFIFGFLPLALVIYYLLLPSRKLQNLWLVIVSFGFYAWGEPKLVLLMACSIFVNYIFGILVNLTRRKKKIAYIYIGLMLCYNLGVLFLFKYLHFVLGIFHIDGSFWNVTLPIGISFYTFQAISYVIDVYRGDGEVQYNPLNVALYIAFFPQLIAGPIVRYETVAQQIKYRKESVESIQKGIKRFIIGLAKKLILANSFAVFADYAFVHISELSVVSAWIGAIAYMMQIYFDFSGYSDMAIGLGKMFGFQFLENFHYPYLSNSVSDFWRRWHQSLGSWFRDYVYIPLGGSRSKTVGRRFFNLFVVWLLTGIWHGANWTFIAWGLFYFVLLAFEKGTKIPERLSGSGGKGCYRIFTLLCVLLGWVVFRAASLTEAFQYMQIMFSGGNASGVMDDLAWFWIKDIKWLMMLGVICSTTIPKKITGFLNRKMHAGVMEAFAAVAYILLFLLCISYSVNGSYDPFIYFNF